MLRYWQILRIAGVTIDTLKEIGIEDCCFIGSMACKLYTNGKAQAKGASASREKRAYIQVYSQSFSCYQDIDILCFTPYTRNVEDIKEQICEADDRFYLKQGRGNYQVLYWRTDDDDQPNFKVDILLPGTLDLPDVSPNYIVKIQRLPCAPLVLLLLHKLKAWDDRRRSARQDWWAKLQGDVQDIEDLLRIASQRGLKLNKHRPYITHSFRKDSYERVADFTNVYPKHGSEWVALSLSRSLVYGL
jgi:hypothetical protein